MCVCVCVYVLLFVFYSGFFNVLKKKNYDLFNLA